ncbi:MAG: FG-GAP-like repeat-containing protein, partial [Acidobacteriota bacterium]
MRRALATSRSLPLVLFLAAAPVHAATVSEGAESGLARVTVQVPADFPVISSTVYADPKSHSFHMGHIGFNPEDQWVMLNAFVVPQPGTELRFASRLAWSGSGESAHVQVSVDGGSWQDTAFAQQGTDTAGETTFNARTMSLQPYVGRSLRIRFYYRYTSPGNSLSYVSDSIGWFVDRIAVVTAGVTVLSEGAESGLATVTAQVPPGYTQLFSSTVFADPPFHSFHLAHIGFAPIDQWVMLNAPFVPQPGSEVLFQSRLAWSGSGESAHVQVSVAGGGWQDTEYSQQGSDTSGEAGFNARALNLALFVGSSIRIRFYYRYTPPGNALSYASDNIGWFIDQIAVTNVLEIVPKADFDSNGRADILWRNGATGQNTAWLVDGQGGVTAAALPPVFDQSWKMGAAGDFDGDGKTDILWRNATTGENVIWRMDGTSVLAQVALPPVFDLNWQIRGAADFDGDGKL